MPRSRRALERIGDGAGDDARERLGGIHGGGVGDEHAVDAARLGELPVARQVARIPGEVFVRAELERIDENADHDTIRELTRAVHESQMAFVEISHSGNETDGMTARALGVTFGD